MAHEVCHDVSEWVEDSILQPVEQCVRRKCKWWCACCNKWFCFLVWIVVVVGSWVVHTVCETVADTVDLLKAVVVGLWEIVAGVFTWDWGRVWDGLVSIFTTAVGVAFDLFRIATLGDFVGFVSDAVSRWRLRDYVRGLIDSNSSYTDDERRRIKSALGVDGGGFGLRLGVGTPRGYVRSDARSGGNGSVPDLVTWHNDPNDDTRVDLKILTGFSSTSFWQRGRPEVVGDQGDISESDIDAYLANPNGKGVKHFGVYCMSTSVLEVKLNTAVMKAVALGLKLRFKTQDVQFTKPSQVRLFPSPSAAQTFFAAAPFNRVRGSIDLAGAQRDLCSPLATGTFLFTDNSFTGYSAHLKDSTCLDGSCFRGDDVTGSVFRDRLPDFAFRYVPIHELGHTFGLCHVDGLNRIMYSPKEKDAWDWWLIPDYLWLHGEPGFTLDEAKRVWDYIIANFSVGCLSTRQFD